MVQSPPRRSGASSSSISLRGQSRSRWPRFAVTVIDETPVRDPIVVEGDPKYLTQAVAAADDGQSGRPQQFGYLDRARPSAGLFSFRARHARLSHPFLLPARRQLGRQCRAGFRHLPPR